MAICKIKAQVTLEFTTAFICLIIFLVATAKIFVWFGGTIVNRHKAYEDTRTTRALVSVIPTPAPASTPTPAPLPTPTPAGSAPITTPTVSTSMTTQPPRQDFYDQYSDANKLDIFEH